MLLEVVALCWGVPVVVDVTVYCVLGSDDAVQERRMAKMDSKLQYVDLAVESLIGMILVYASLQWHLCSPLSFHYVNIGIPSRL